MKKGNLSARLTALKAGKKSTKISKTLPGIEAGKDFRKDSGPEDGTIPGWERIAPFVLRKETVFPHAEMPVAGLELKKVYGITPGKNLLFFDLETTGLSGGAGNIAFLAGVGKFRDNDFRLVQIFLEDYPGEREFLLELKNYLSTGEIWVSYNGKSFDTSLLKTRFLMNGEEPVIGDNLDLLYPSRRLWKTILPDCSLGTIEGSVLRKERILDIPGRMIPDIYFNYLRTQEAGELKKVFAHHKEDILSLLDLFNLLGRIFSEAEDPIGISFDPSGLGYLLISSGFSRGVSILEKGFSKGNRRCGIILGEYFKRNRYREKAFRVWKRLWDDNQDLISGIELAKEYEHRRKEFTAALEIVDRLLTGKNNYPSRILKELVHRKERLERKLNQEFS